MKFYETHCVLEYGEIANTKEVEFCETDTIFSDGIHVVLCDDLSSFGIVLCWCVIDECSWRNDDTCGMDGDMTHTAFKFFREIDDLFHFTIGVVKALEVGLDFHCVVECHREAL